MLDACLIINLCAARAVEDLATADVHLAAVEQVTNEVLFLDDGNGDREALSVDSFIRAGHIEKITLTGDAELRSLLSHVRRLGDGEAASLSAAAHRSYVLATDDRLALQCAQQHDPPVQCVTTPDVVSWWADAAELSAVDLAHAIERIERFACYRPPPAHPLNPWWRAAAARLA